MGGDNHKICGLVPAHNEEQNIGPVVEKALRHLDCVYVIDDGSSDETSGIAKDAGGSVIRHEVNMGKGKALKTGFARIMEDGFDAMVTLDGDGQHDPSEIPAFIEAFNAGLGEIIVGNRLWDRERIPRSRYRSNMVGVFMISMATGQKIPDTQSGYRLYSSGLIRNMKIKSDGFDAETEILLRAGKAGCRIHSIPIQAIYPAEYKTHFRSVRDFTKISLTYLRTIFGG